MKTLLRIALLLFFTFAAACSKPVPPKLTPKSAEVKSVSITGLEVALTIDVDNPNDIPLSAQSVKGKVKLSADIDLGDIEVDTKVTVPAKSHKEVIVPMSVKWTDLSAVGMLAATHDKIPFTFDGTAAIGVADAHFDVPFTVTGSVTREQLLQITQKALPKIPGL